MPSPPPEHIGWTLWQATQVWRRDFTDRMVQAGHGWFAQARGNLMVHIGPNGVRQGDLVDFSLGIVKCGLAKTVVSRVKDRFPNAGFHQRLVQLEVSWFSRHPFRPVPVLKW